MSVNMKFLADFGSFDLAVDRSVLKLKNFALEPGKVERALSTMTDSFTGRKLIADATLAAEAVERIGGVSRLTEAELKKVATQAAAAAEKLRLMGQEVPEKLASLASKLEPLPKQLTLAQQAAGLLSSTFGQMTSALAFTSILERGVTTVAQWATEAVDAAGKTVDLANKLGFSTEAVQRMSFVADQTGSSLDGLEKAAFQLELRFGKNRDAVNDLGISWTNLRNASPEERFNAVVGALGKMDDAQQRNLAGVQLFGRTFAELAPGVVEGYADIAGQAKVSSDAQVRALDAAGDRWSKFVKDLKTNVTSGLGEVLLYFDRVEQQSRRQFAQTADNQQVPGAGKTDISLNGAVEASAALTDYVAKLKDARADTAGLTSEQIRQIKAAQELGVSIKELSEEYDVSEASIKRLNEATKAQEDLMGTGLVQRAGALLDAIRSLDAQGLRPAKGSFDEITAAMVAAQGVMASTGRAGEAMYEQLEAARRRFSGLTAEGLIPSSVGNQAFALTPAPSIEQDAGDVAELQAVEAKIDAENRYNAEVAETTDAVAEQAAAHADAASAAVSGTDKASGGYGRLKQAALEASAAIKLMVPQGFDYVQAYKDAGFSISENTVGRGGNLSPATGFSVGTAGIFGAQPGNITVNVDARDAQFNDAASVERLADRVGAALQQRQGR